MTKQVLLANGRIWKRQADALDHFKAMLARYRNGDRVTDAQDHSDLCAVLLPYDACVAAGEPTKAGPGVDHFTRQVNIGTGYASAGFHVHRVDGSSIDFSYIEAVKSASQKK